MILGKWKHFPEKIEDRETKIMTTPTTLYPLVLGELFINSPVFPRPYHISVFPFNHIHHYSNLSGGVIVGTKKAQKSTFS